MLGRRWSRRRERRALGRSRDCELSWSSLLGCFLVFISSSLLGLAGTRVPRGTKRFRPGGTTGLRALALSCSVAIVRLVDLSSCPERMCVRRARMFGVQLVNTPKLRGNLYVRYLCITPPTSVLRIHLRLYRILRILCLCVVLY